MARAPNSATLSDILILSEVQENEQIASTTMVRVLLADSGRYLSPTDRFAQTREAMESEQQRLRFTTAGRLWAVFGKHFPGQRLSTCSAVHSTSESTTHGEQGAESQKDHHATQSLLSAQRPTSHTTTPNCRPLHIHSRTSTLPAAWSSVPGNMIVHGVWPDTLDTRKRSSLEQYYRAMPGELHTTTSDHPAERGRVGMGHA